MANPMSNESYGYRYDNTNLHKSPIAHLPSR